MSVKALRMLFLALNLLFGAALLVAGAVTYLGFIEQKVPRRSYAKNRRRETASLEGIRMPPLNEYASIWRMRAVPADNEEPEVVDVGPEESTLDQLRRMLESMFNLVGIFFNLTTPDDSYAVVQLRKQGNQTRTVSPGDMLSSAEVKAVERDRVVFRFKEKDVGLDMGVALASFSRGPRAAGPPGAAGRIDRPTGAGIDAQGRVVNAALAFKGSRRLGPNQWQIERRELQHLARSQSRIINDYQLRIHVGKGGKTDGVEVGSVPENSYAAQRGFKKGDVVHSIGGVKVTSMNDFSKIAEKLKNSRRVVFQVKRRGRPVTMTYTLR